jgi:TolB-like protein
MKPMNLCAILCGLIVLGLVGCEAHRGQGKTAVKLEKVAPEGQVSKVIIKPFAASGVAEQDVFGISSRFCVDLSKTKTIELVCAEDLAHVFKHQEDMVKFGSCEEEDCLSKMGNILEADFILQGNINKVGQTLTMALKLIDGKTGKVRIRLDDSTDSDEVDALLEIASGLANQLASAF